MKKYVRLRQECSEFDNALFDASPERLAFRDTVTSSDFFRSQSRPPVVLSSSDDGSASPQRDSPPAIRLARPPQPHPAPTTTNGGPSHTDLTEALQKLASYREGSSRRHSAVVPRQSGEYPRSESGRWPVHSHDLLESDPRDASGSERWQAAETASLSGRWSSVTSANDDAQQHPFRDALSLSRSGRLEGELWTAAAPMSLQPSLSGRRILAVDANEHHHQQLAPANISMRETQGWLASVKRPLQQRNAWVDPNEFNNWRANGKFASSSSSSSRKAVSQSMRYDRLKTSAFDEEGEYYHQQHSSSSSSHSVMQKAASMREGGVHSDAIMAMARAYSEKHGVPHQQAILECVACGRGLGVIVQGNPGNDTSFCHSCRSHAWTHHHTNAAPEINNNKSKRKGMMHYCKKILRMGSKKPNKLKP